MAFNTRIIAPVTAAVATPQPYDSTNCSQCIIAADALATTETCVITVNVVGSTYVPFPSILNTAATLTATVPAVVLPGGVIYGVTKALTAGACGVYGTPVKTPGY